MGNSLRDALTKAGVVSTNQAKLAAQQEKKQARRELHAKRSGQITTNEVSLTAAKLQEEKLAKDQELNRALDIATAAKAARAQVRQLLKAHCTNDDAADLKFNFVEGTQIRHIYTTTAQREELVKGRLAIVSFGERHYLVNSEIAAKVTAIIPEVFVYYHTQDDQTNTADDLYAEYKIPDDLIW